jgi:uncharacterized damage-inducible protein DinB
MSKRLLIPPAGYGDGAAVTTALAAQLDPLLASLTRRVKDATVEQLEWQLRPGFNTIGMLLAHLALSETFWIQAAPLGIDADDEVDRIVFDLTGIHLEDDGMLVTGTGTHPAALAGKTAADYLAILHRAREATHATVRGWDDRTLEQTREVDGNEVSRAWILFHVTEHFAHHLGQIALLTRLHGNPQTA